MSVRQFCRLKAEIETNNQRNEELQRELDALPIRFIGSVVRTDGCMVEFPYPDAFEALRDNPERALYTFDGEEARCEYDIVWVTERCDKSKSTVGVFLKGMRRGYGVVGDQFWVRKP